MRFKAKIVIFVVLIFFSTNSIQTKVQPHVKANDELSILQKVFADGFHAELIPPVSIEGRDIALFVKMQPTFILEGTTSDVTLDVRLFESQTNKTITDVTYVIYFGKFDPDTESGVRPLLLEMFYSSWGPLTLHLIPTEGGVSVNASKSQNSDAWLADPSGAIDYGTPVLIQGGLYYVGVIIAGMNSPDQFFPEGSAPLFEAGLSVGYAADYQVEYSNATHDITIISYYDKITDFQFDPNEYTYSWSMPFDWNLDRIEENRNILVHHEIRIPKSLENLAGTYSFEGTINDVPLSKAKIALDPFSFEDYLTIHYILNKPDIISLSRDVPAGSSEMRFTLTMLDENDPLGKDTETQTVLFTEGSGIQIRLDWEPSTLQAGEQSKIMVQFYDELTGKAMDRDIIYDLSVRNIFEEDLLSGKDLVARKGKDVQVVTFPANDKYFVEINVKGFLVEKEYGNGTLEQSVDVNRAGIARGVVIVPEFPYPLFLGGVGLTALLIINRLRK